MQRNSYKSIQLVATRYSAFLLPLFAIAVMALPHNAEALDFDPETVQMSELFPADTYIDPRDFGAVGDGVTDDTAAVLAAIAAIEANGQGVLVFDEGDYYLPTWPEGGVVIRVPSGIQGNNATLRGNGSAILFEMGKQFLVEGMHLENWRIGIEFRRVGSATNFENTDWVIIRDNRFEAVNHPMHAYRAGSFRVALAEDPAPNRIDTIVITRNKIHNARSGIRIAVIHVDHIIISNNSFKHLTREDFDSDSDATSSILSAISIGQDSESLENNQKISNVYILNNHISNLYNFDIERDRVYGILNYRGPDVIANNWLENFHSPTSRTMGIYTRSASDAVTKYNVLIDVSSDATETGQPSRAAISSKKPNRTHHLVEGNTIIFTESYKEATNNYRYAGILMGNQDVEYRGNLLIGCVNGGIETWSLSGNHTDSVEQNLIFDSNILINCTGPAFSNYYGRIDIVVTNNTLLRHSGSLFHHASVAASRPVERLLIENNTILESIGSSSIINNSGHGILTRDFQVRNNYFEHIGTKDLDSFGPYDGASDFLGTWHRSFFDENTSILIEDNTIIGLRQNWSSSENISPGYVIRLHEQIAELLIRNNYFKFGHRLFNPDAELLPNRLTISNNHIENFTSILSFVGTEEPSQEQWDAISIDLRDNTGNFDTTHFGNHLFSAASESPQEEYQDSPTIDKTAEIVANRIFNFDDETLKNYLFSDLDWLIGSIPEPDSSDWTFRPLQMWAK